MHKLKLKLHLLIHKGLAKCIPFNKIDIKSDMALKKNLFPYESTWLADLEMKCSPSKISRKFVTAPFIAAAFGVCLKIQF